jgi:hypothetical protein
MCPSTAATDATSAASVPHSAPINTAATPFPTSKTRVTAANTLLPVRSTLVAPILPEPTRRMSPIPPSRVSSSPNGIEPSR